MGSKRTFGIIVIILFLTKFWKKICSGERKGRCHLHDSLIGQSSLDMAAVTKWLII